VIRVATIDRGTNSLRMLVSELDGDAQHDLDRRLEVVRLGQGVDRVRMVATSAGRDAANRDEFVTGVYAVSGRGSRHVSRAGRRHRSRGSSAALRC
jgi:exopolyphosphatase / guanosine-5'-triphosphate,3'-diphosphate pyrophosphatase